MQTFNPEQILLRRLFTKGVKAYGPGVPQLEMIVQETILDIVDQVHQKCEEPINTQELSNGYVCCTIASMVRLLPACILKVNSMNDLLSNRLYLECTLYYFTNFTNFSI